VNDRATRRSKEHLLGRERALTVTEHAFRVGIAHLEAGEELRRHAPAATRVVRAARRARPRVARFAKRLKQFAVLPHVSKAGTAHVAGPELLVDHEGTGVDLADRIDQTDDATGAAEVQSRERFAER